MKITINDQILEANEGESILNIARANGIYIPALCYLSGCSPTLACRLCMVEANGKVVYSCNAKAKEDMQIYTNTPEIAAERNAIMQTYCVNHPLQCGVCDKSGECELQNLTTHLNVKEQSFAIEDTHKPHKKWGLINYDPALCVVCERCVTVCKDKIGESALKTVPRGVEVPKELKESMPKDAYAVFSKMQKSLIGPSAGENLLWMAKYMVAFGFIASMGEATLSVQTIYFQITLLILLCGASISVANEVIVGHLVGASEFNEAYARTFKALWLGISITLVVVLIAYALKYKIMDALNLDDGLRKIMLPLFTLSIVLEAGRTFNIVIVNALRASGDAKFPLATGLIFMWGLSLPLGYFLGIHLGWGIVGVWIGFCADEWLRGLANTWRWRSKKWQEKRLV